MEKLIVKNCEVYENPSLEELIIARNNLLDRIFNNNNNYVSDYFLSFGKDKIIELLDILIDQKDLLLYKIEDVEFKFPYRLYFRRDYKINKITGREEFTPYASYVLKMPDNKYYVGQCRDKRSKENRRCNNNIELSRWNKGKGYEGQEKVWSILSKIDWEDVDKNILITGINEHGSLVVEEFFIQELNSYKNGYNSNEGGVGVPKGHRQTLETRLKRSESAKKSIPVKDAKYVGHKKGEEDVYFSTQREGAKLCKVKQPNINRVLKGIVPNTCGWTFEYIFDNKNKNKGE